MPKIKMRPEAISEWILDIYHRQFCFVFLLSIATINQSISASTSFPSISSQYIASNLYCPSAECILSSDISADNIPLYGQQVLSASVTLFAFNSLFIRRSLPSDA